MSTGAMSDIVFAILNLLCIYLFCINVLRAGDLFLLLPLLIFFVPFIQVYIGGPTQFLSLLVTVSSPEAH